MKRIVVAFAVVGLAWGTARAGVPEGWVPQARQAVRALVGQLEGALGTALREGGPRTAIPVCRTDAPEIAAKVSESTGWKVGRTSLRYRNPANAPDAWERKVLARFETRRAAGVPPGRLEFSEVVQTGGARVFRYMKAIPTGRVCLACHGATIDPQVAAAIHESYPDDRATGFAVGDLRGAFTLQKPVP